MTPLGLGLGLGLGGRGGGASFNPLSIPGCVLLIDCKAPEQLAEIREVDGVNTSWKKLVNLANPDNSATYPDAANEALYQNDGGFGWTDAHINILQSLINFRTIIVALKNTNPEEINVANPVLTNISAANVFVMKSSRTDVGYPGGCGLTQGSQVTVKLRTDTPVGDGASAVIAMRNQAAPNGVIRYNGISQTLVTSTGTNESLTINKLAGHDSIPTVRWNGTIYAIYLNSNPMSDEDISAIEDWMKARYSI